MSGFRRETKLAKGYDQSRAVDTWEFVSLFHFCLILYIKKLSLFF